jgi:tetratricopeptide (TPR) repeat protein
MKIKHLVVFVLSVAALVAGIYIGYRLLTVKTPEGPPPEGEVKEEGEIAAEPDTASIDEDITLPGELRERLEERRAERDRLYEQAKNAHRAGELEQAEQLYRQVVALSPRDMTAANSYRFLGDIFSSRKQFSRALQFYSHALELGENEPVFHYRRGLIFEELGRSEDASSSFSRALELEKQADFYMARGNNYFAQSLYSDAIDDYRQAVSLQERPKIYINLGLAYKRRGDVDSAIETFEKLLELDFSEQKRYEVLMNLGRLYFEQQLYTEAIEQFDRALKINTTPAAFYNLGQARLRNEDFTGAIEALQEAVQQDPQNFPVYVDLGYAREQTEDYRGSIRAYERALELKPEATSILYALGRLYEKIDRPVVALDFYRRLVEIEEGPRLGDVYRRMGEIFLNQNENEMAISAFRNAALLNPDEHEIEYNLGIAYFRAGRQEDALTELREALSGDTGSVDYRLALAEVLFLSGYRSDSLKQFKLILEQNPDHYQANYMAGYIHYSRGETSLSREYFQSLADKTNDDLQLMNIYQNIGNIYLKEKKYDQAKTSYRQALETREEASLYYNLGLTYIYEDEWEKAAASLQKAAEDLGDNSKVRAALGFVFYRLGMYEQAEKELERAIDLEPQNTRAHYDLKRVREIMNEDENAE